MDSRILKYEAILLERDDLTLTTDEALNPATFLEGRQEGGAPENKCLDMIEYQTKVSPDLGETSFQTKFHFFVDGYSRLIKGKRHNGYSIVDREAMTIIESGQLPNNWSAQTCKLFALNQSLKHLKDKEWTIHTDSKYAFGVVHTFGKIWMEWGLINHKGQDLVHGESIQQIIESLKLPEKIAIVHVSGHQKVQMRQQNRLLSLLRPRSFVLFHTSLLLMSPLIFTPSEEELKKHGAVRTEQGNWVLPNVREMIS
jgi:ribonuclease HI